MKKVTKDRIQRTVTLPEELDERLRLKAAELKSPISYLVEKAIVFYLESEAAKGERSAAAQAEVEPAIESVKAA